MSSDAANGFIHASNTIIDSNTKHPSPVVLEKPTAVHKLLRNSKFNVNNTTAESECSKVICFLGNIPGPPGGGGYCHIWAV